MKLKSDTLENDKLNNQLQNLSPLPIGIGLCGSTGKMGKMIIKKLEESSSCRLLATFSRQNNIEDIGEFCKNSTIIIDFSSSDILDQLLKSALTYKNKLVIGTTGLSNQQIDLLQESGKELAILYSPNMSLGANLLAMLAKKSSEILGKSYDIEIVDSHHRCKKDAPSGTALMLGEILAQTRNLNFPECGVFSRAQKEGRSVDEIGIASIRGGKQNGEHEVLFLGDHEVVSMKHMALSREPFADGAIKAAIWINDKAAGFYSMHDIFYGNR